MTFNATWDLVYDKTYTVTINGALAKDANGNLLDGNNNGIAEGSPVDDYSWQFTVESAPPIPDTTKPISSVSPLPSYTNTLSLQLSYTSSDDDSGVVEVELFFMKGSDVWALYNTYTNASDTITFTADSDGTYSFYTRARDNEDNYEDTPTSFDATIIVDTSPPTIDVGSNRSANSEFTQNSMTNDTGSGIDTYDWIKVSGPGNIIFGSENAPSTTIRASTEGAYSIRLTVTDKAGNSAIDEFTLIWDMTRPSVESKGPSGINVPITTVVTITFIEPLDKSQFESYFSISPNVPGTFIWNDTGTVLTFIPSSDLDYDTVYTIKIEAEGIVDIAGNTIFNDLEFTFKTAATTPSGSGSIEGQVKDENGNPIIGAMVSLEGTTISTTTDSNGNYSFINVPTGIYNLTIESTGYREKTTSVTVLNGGNTKLPATTMISDSEEPEEEGAPIFLILIIVIIVVVILLVLVGGKWKKTKEDDHQGMKDSISEPAHKEPGDEKEMEGYLKEEAAGEPSGSSMFECPLCNTMVSEDAVSCPGCGAIFSDEEEDHTSEGKEEESTVSEEENPYFKCPECGTYMYAGATSCPECGVSFAAEEDEKIEALEDEPAYFKCPECGTHVEADATSCPGCGVGFAD
jgi:RNA polymerase subunit RPABC4/transcription elongation factor Spt4